jgi:hypothetical protein
VLEFLRLLGFVVKVVGLRVEIFVLLMIVSRGKKSPGFLVLGFDAKVDDIREQ